MLHRRPILPSSQQTDFGHFGVILEVVEVCSQDKTVDSPRPVDLTFVSFGLRALALFGLAREKWMGAEKMSTVKRSADMAHCVNDVSVAGPMASSNPRRSRASSSL